MLWTHKFYFIMVQHHRSMNSFTHEPLVNSFKFFPWEINYGNLWVNIWNSHVKKINWPMVGREIGIISRSYFANKYGRYKIKLTMGNWKIVFLVGKFPNQRCMFYVPHHRYISLSDPVFLCKGILYLMKITILLRI